MITSFKVSPLQMVVLLHHVIHCEDAENDADRTVKELITELDRSNGRLPKGLFESALYCCNLEAEKGKFWHPFGSNFDKFIYETVPNEYSFDRYYNVLYEKKDY